MHIKLKQHLAIATGAVSAAAVPMGADAAIGYKDNSNAFSVSYAETGSAEWDIDGAGGNDFRLFTSTASTFRYVAFDSAGGGRNGRGFAATGSGSRVFNNLPAGAASTGALLGPTLSAGY